MIFITLSDGVITKKMAYSARLTRRNEGYEKNEIFYTTDLIKVPNLELVAKDGGITMVGAGQFTIEVLSSEAGYDSVVDFSSKDLSVIVQIWDEDNLSPIYTVLTGRAYLGAMNRKQYTYRLKSEKGELANNLLNPAPDIRQNAYLDADKSFYFETVDQGGNWSNTYNDNRLFPMRLGVIKHAPLFQLAYNAPITQPLESVGQYYADGTVKALYDNGLKIRFSQYTGDYRILKNNASSQAVYELTMDIDGDDTAVNSDTTSPNPQELTTTFAQSTEPAPADVVLKDGMIWIDTTGSSNIKYIYQNGAWVKVTVSLIESTDFVDIPTGAGFRLKANAAGTSDDPTIFGAYIKGGTIEGTNFTVDNLKVSADGYPNNFGKVTYSTGRNASGSVSTTVGPPTGGGYSHTAEIYTSYSSLIYHRSYGTGLLSTRATSDGTEYNISVAISGTVSGAITYSLLGTIFVDKNGVETQLGTTSYYNGTISFTSDMKFRARVRLTMVHPSSTSLIIPMSVSMLVSMVN